MELRSQFNYDTMKASDECALHCTDATKTQQHQAEEADINTIVRRFGLTGQLPENVRAPQYGDFTGVTTYQEALNAVKAANESFMQMPADVRKRFDNDPERFVEFCSDDKNYDEAISLGLVPAKPKVAASQAPAGGAVAPS